MTALDIQIAHVSATLTRLLAERARIATAQTDTKVKVQDVISSAAGIFGVSERQITGPRRTKDIRMARWAAITVAAEITGYSSARLGKIFGMDHTSILYAVRRLKEECIRDGAYADRVSALMARVR